MDQQQARRINEIFERALDLEGAERDAYLQKFDDATRASVGELLASCDELGEFLEQSAPEHWRPRTLDPGTRVGAYRIVRAIGAGSGGTVYEAEQQSPRRRVALKIRMDPLASAATHRRFREEAEILARLRHPLIAHVYEAGIHEDVPFFALELVPDARTLTEHTERLGRKERLALFIALCDAVHHGHLKGVVHRDLKPGNILVPPDGDPKIVDFGIARVEGAAISGAAMVGTPPYMSPEQCAGPAADIDARADVYSLGVLLYQLLADALPHETRGLPITEATRRVRESPPSPLPRSVPADLCAVVDKALAKDREERYDSAAQLAEDVRRFLRFDPVVARRASWLHQLRLFGRRHRVLMLAATLLLAMLIGAVAVSSSYAIRAQQAQEREEVEAYIAHLAAADGALRLHRTTEARSHLRQAAAALRGWEWELLASRLDASIASYPIPGSAHARFDPRGDRVVFAGPGQAFFAAPFDATAFESPEILHREGLRSKAWFPAFSPDGARIAFGHDDGTISVRDARSYATVATLEGHTGQAVHLAFRPDGKQIAACYHDGALLVWELATGELRLKESGKSAARIAYAPDGTRIAVGLRNGEVAIWDVSARKLVRTIEAHRGAVHLLAFLPRGAALVTGGDDAWIAIWDVASGRRRAVYADREARILCGALTSDARRAVTGHADGTLTVWDLENGLVDAVLPGHVGEVASVTLAPDGKHLVSTGSRFIKVWRMPPSRDARSGEYPNVVRAVGFDAAGTRLAIAVWDGTVRVRSLTGEFEEFVLEGHKSQVQAVEFSPDGKTLASGGNDGVRIWDLESRAGVMHVPSPSGGEVVGLAFDEKGEHLAWADWRGMACLWEIASQRITQTHRHAGHAKDVFFLPGGGLWGCASHPDKISVHDRKSGETVRTVRLGTRALGGAELSRDGKRLAVAAENGVFLYDVAGWKLIASHRVGTSDLVTLAWGRGDERLALATGAGVRIIDPVHGRTVLTHPTRTWIWDLRFSPGGEQLAFGTGSYGRGHCTAQCIGRAPGEEWPPPLVRTHESR